MKPARRNGFFSLLLAGILAATVGCGGSSNSSTSSGSGSNAPNNVQTITVNAGPPAGTNRRSLNQAFPTVLLSPPPTTSNFHTTTAIPLATTPPRLPTPPPHLS